MNLEEAIEFLKHRLNLGVKGSVYYAERAALQVAIDTMEKELMRGDC